MAVEQTEVDECVRQQVRPELAKGAIRDNGRYYRNLKDEDVGEVYTELPGGSTIKVRANKVRKLRDITLQRGFSVNCVVCMTSRKCALVLHPQGEQFKHLWEINLARLNEHAKTFEPPEQFVAEYDPVDELRNHCHFLIKPTGSTSAEMIPAILEHLETKFPSIGGGNPKKRPPEGSDFAVASAILEYEEVCIVHSNV